MIYAVLWNCCNSFGHCRAILVEGREKDRKQGRSQNIDDLPILATCQSGTLAMLAKLMIPLLMEALEMTDMVHRCL